MTNDSWQDQIASGERFRFGENWAQFLSTLKAEQITRAEESLKELLNRVSLSEKSFLDIGSGSGIFSLAARRLGAKVTSIDLDPASVACTEELKRRYYPHDPDWQILRGSALDATFMSSLGDFEIVYSWGVLHHTGDMWAAIENAVAKVNLGGLCAIALYNDQGALSAGWRVIKKIYCSSWMGRMITLIGYIPCFILIASLIDISKLKNPITRYQQINERGMTVYYDWFDWLGGLPFEVARPRAVIDFMNIRKMKLILMKTTKGSGCNQFLFQRES